MKKTLLQTYLFWALFSFYNINLLGAFLIPPLLLLVPDFYAKFFPFLVLPFIISLLLTSLTTFLTYRYWSQYIKGYSPLAYNFLFLVFFLLSANYYKNILILDRLQKYNVNYAYVNSFLYSVYIASEEYQFNSHAVFYKNEKLYLWSYRDLDFYICPENARNNISISRTKLYRDNHSF
ncbi:hypothetical protein [Sulfurimonas sp.]|uniref:hypothetical protein n=1 Tax=Sulfurimonas sp. TaxID=2022749 RepID=UPI003D1206C4